MEEDLDFANQCTAEFVADVYVKGMAHVQSYQLENQGISSNWGRVYLRRG